MFLLKAKSGLERRQSMKQILEEMGGNTDHRQKMGNAEGSGNVRKHELIEAIVYIFVFFSGRPEISSL